MYRLQRSSRTTEGKVYIAECQGLYKIGYTSGDPLGRIAALQTGNPFPVELIGSIPGSRALEKHLHAVYRARKVRGEWHALTYDEVKEILGWTDEPEEITKLRQILACSTPAQQRSFIQQVNKILGI